MDNLVPDKGLKDTFPYLDNITVAGHTQEKHDRKVKRLLECLQRRKWTLNNSKTINSISSINIISISYHCLESCLSLARDSNRLWSVTGLFSSSFFVDLFWQVFAFQFE